MDIAEMGATLATLEGQEHRLLQQERELEQLHQAVDEASLRSIAPCESM